MDPKQLKILAVVVKLGSLTRASEQLFVSQPTLTRGIKQLEMKVGAPLLQRSRYGVKPTDIGARLAQIGERIVAEAEHADEVIRQWHSGYHNEFSIGIDPLWEFATDAHMIKALLAEKRYVFHLRTGSAAAQIALLQAGELDFLLAPAYLSVAQTSLDREVIFRDCTGVFVGKRSNLYGSKQAISKAVLKQKNWMVAGLSAGFFDELGEVASPKASKISFTGSIRSVIHLLNTSDMLVRLPARLALLTGEITHANRLTVDEHVGPRRDIALWSREDYIERPETTKVREFLSEMVKDLDNTLPTFGLGL